MGERDAVRVGEGRLGRGVFAARDVDEGETLELCPTLEVADADVGGLLGDYVFRSGADPNNVILMLGYGMLYNHSYDANCEYVQDGPDAITYLTTRDVAAGEELTIDYGEEWWSTRNLEPGD